MTMTRRFDPDKAAMAAEVIDDLPRMLFAARSRRQLSLRGAAEQIGCSHSILNRLECGQLPNGETLLKILRWIGRGR